MTTFEGHLDSLLEEAMPRLGVPGAVISLVHGGVVAWTKGYGQADKENGVPATPETVFQAASISKPVAAWEVMRLVEAGRLALDAPVERYLTRWHLPPSDFDHDGVTIRRLLSHTAGLSLEGYPGFPPDEKLPSLEESLSGAASAAAPWQPGGVRVIQEPGSGYRYSGGGYTLLQLAIEEVTGEAFADVMQREVLAPLGMARSAYEWTPLLRPVTATGYDDKGHPLPNFLFTAKAAAGLYTAAADLGRFVAASMPGPDGEPAGRGILREDTLARMVEAHPETGAEYGLGYEVWMLSDGKRVAAHGGANQGWRGYFGWTPAEQAGIVILTNSDNGDALIEHVITLWTMHFPIGEQP
jgi:CubicO group peptidase (beta-lactamase class C family)